MANSIDTMNADLDELPMSKLLVLAGPAGGVAGGVVMAAYLVFAAAVQGMEPLVAIHAMGATFLDVDAPGTGPGAALYGLLLHLGFSAVIGLLFAAILPQDFPPGTAGFLCVGFTIVVMGLMTSMVLPAINPVLKEHFRELGGSWVIAHALFGLAAGYLCQRLRHAWLKSSRTG